MTTRIVTIDNWAIIDRILDGSLGGALSNKIKPSRRYASGDEAREAWRRLPRWDMATGGTALTDGLMAYNAWVTRFVSPANQVNLVVDAAVEAAEAATTDVATVGFGNKSRWLLAAAARNGIGIDEFIHSKLAPTIADERERYRDELLRGGQVFAGIIEDRLKALPPEMRTPENARALMPRD